MGEGLRGRMPAAAIMLLNEVLEYTRQHHPLISPIASNPKLIHFQENPTWSHKPKQFSHSSSLSSTSQVTTPLTCPTRPIFPPSTSISHNTTLTPPPHPSKTLSHHQATTHSTPILQIPLPRTTPPPKKEKKNKKKRCSQPPQQPTSPTTASTSHPKIPSSSSTPSPSPRKPPFSPPTSPPHPPHPAPPPPLAALAHPPPSSSKSAPARAWSSPSSPRTHSISLGEEMCWRWEWM